MRQSYTVLEEILLSGAPFEEGFSFGLAQCKREAFIIQRLLAKIYHPGCWIFPRYIIRHMARQRKKTRALAFTGKLQLWAPFEEGFSFAVEKPAGPLWKRSLHYTEAPGKYISPGRWIFPRYIIRHMARQRKKTGLWHLQVGCNYELLLRKASLSQWRSLLAQCDREAFIIYSVETLGKHLSPRTLTFPQIHHQTHS